MKNLNELAVKNVESDLESGFFWVEFENGKSLQCCLVAKHQSDEEFHANGPIYLECVSVSNNGSSEGICRDINRWVIDDSCDWENVSNFLIHKAEEHGLGIVG